MTNQKSLMYGVGALVAVLVVVVVVVYMKRHKSYIAVPGSGSFTVNRPKYVVPPIDPRKSEYSIREGYNYTLVNNPPKQLEGDFPITDVRQMVSSSGVSNTQSNPFLGGLPGEMLSGVSNPVPLSDNALKFSFGIKSDRTPDAVDVYKTIV